jgi:arylsulfatase A-like enzyme
MVAFCAFAIQGCEKQPAPAQPDAKTSAGPAVAIGELVSPAVRESLIKPPSAALPNVIVIVVDTLRADRLGCYGHPANLTPTMDQIAAEGVRFSRVIAAAPWTLPSVGSLITCYGPSVHKANSFKSVSDMDRGQVPVVAMLDDSFTTLAEVMKQAGYETGGFSANKFIKAKYGMGQGYDEYDTSYADNTVQGTLINKAATDWLKGRAASDKPFFLYLHYMDVHGPYDADSRFMDPLMQAVEANPNKRQMPEAVFGRINGYLRRPPRKTLDPSRWDRLSRYYDYWEARYDAGVAEMDFYLSELIAELKTMGVWDDAYVVLTADHGEALGEHQVWDHGYTQFQTDLHVPLIVRYPGVVPSGRVVHRTASLMDVAPTIYEQLGISFDQSVQGRSLVGHMAASDDAHAVAFADGIKVGPRWMAVVRDNWKLMVRAKADSSRVSQWLYDIEADPGEQQDLSTAHPELVAELSGLLVQYATESRALKPGVAQRTVAPTPDELRQLQGLGYTGGTDEETDEDSDEP